MPLLLILTMLLAGATAPGGSDDALGLGLVQPQLVAGEVLLLYGGRAAEGGPDLRIPPDTLVFVQGAHFVEVHAPPWIFPEAMKLDYDLLFFRARTLSRTWIEIVANRRTGETRWVRREAVRFLPWTDFLLDVAAVDVRDAATNPLRQAPDEASERLPLPAEAVLRPLAIRDQWMLVAVAEEIGGATVRVGWLRWNDGARLLIDYRLLS